MNSFHFAWVISTAVLIGFAAVLGMRAATKSLSGILVDSRGRYSLTHFQASVWTILILGSLIAVLIAASFDPTKLKLSPELLGLMGIVAGSAVFATAVKASKDATRGAKVARAGDTIKAFGPTLRPPPTPVTPPASTTMLVASSAQSAGSPAITASSAMTSSPGMITVKPHFAQIWMEEEGDLAEQVISITKFQNFVITLAIAGVYVAMTWIQNAMPDLPDNIVALIGISHAGYVGGKMPSMK